MTIPADRPPFQRLRLPWRRPGDVVTVEFEGQSFTIIMGHYRDGRPGEVFVSGGKVGSTLDRLLADAAVLASLLLQAGAQPRDLAERLGGLEDGTPASVIGVAVELLVSGNGEGR